MLGPHSTVYFRDAKVAVTESGNIDEWLDSKDAIYPHLDKIKDDGVRIDQFPLQQSRHSLLPNFGTDLPGRSIEPNLQRTSLIAIIILH